MKVRSIAIGWVFSLSVLTAWVPVAASETIQASSATNPAPKEAFSAFDRFELTSIAMGSPYAGQPANDAALTDLQADLDTRIQSWISAKNSQPAKSAIARVLLVEPSIEQIKFVTPGARMWGKRFAGTSGILMKVRISDKATGALIAEPEFYQHAAYMASKFSMGGADKAMLEREASLISDYLQANYAQAVGGRTGNEE